MPLVGYQWRHLEAKQGQTNTVSTTLPLYTATQRSTALVHMGAHEHAELHAIDMQQNKKATISMLEPRCTLANTPLFTSAFNSHVGHNTHAQVHAGYTCTGAQAAHTRACAHAHTKPTWCIHERGATNEL